MNKEFIPYEEALALKELGFDEPCLALYKIHNGKKTIYELVSIRQYEFLPLRSEKSPENKKKDWDRFWVLAPTFSQAFRFFREKHMLHSYIDEISYFNEPKAYQYMIANIDEKEYSIYEEAELACLKKLIEIVKEK